MVFYSSYIWRKPLRGGKAILSIQFLSHEGQLWEGWIVRVVTELQCLTFNIWVPDNCITVFTIQVFKDLTHTNTTAEKAKFIDNRAAGQLLFAPEASFKDVLAQWRMSQRQLVRVSTASATSEVSQLRWPTVDLTATMVGYPDTRSRTFNVLTALWPLT